SPRSIASVTPSTALTSPTWRSSTTPLLIGNQTRRSSISTSAVMPSARRSYRRDLVAPRVAVAGPDLDERRYLLPRLLHLVRAPRGERARGRRAQHVARGTLDRTER